MAALLGRVSFCLWLAAGPHPASPASDPPGRPAPSADHAAVVPAAVVPAPFRGHWSTTPEQCQAPPTDPSQLFIMARTLARQGTRAGFVRVAADDERHAMVTLRARGAAPAGDETEGLTLSPDAQVLTVVGAADGNVARFTRCPPQTEGPGFTPHHAMPPE